MSGWPHAFASVGSCGKDPSHSSIGKFAPCCGCCLPTMATAKMLPPPTALRTPAGKTGRVALAGRRGKEADDPWPASGIGRS